VKFTVQYPLALPGYAPDFLTARGIAAFAAAAEESGFDVLAFTEHPAPSHRWVMSGGHDTFDPTTALACAAVPTNRIKLLPYTLILPYRNPFLLAKTLATLSLASEGRLVVGAGTGYLRSEASALGSDFDERNALFDESVEAMKAIWSDEDVSVTGRHFAARGTTARPRPASPPPWWIGGNGVLARERAASIGEVWMPLIIGEDRVRTLRTPAIPDEAALRAAVDDLAMRVARRGRNPRSVEVQVEGPGTDFLVEEGQIDGHMDLLSRLSSAGADRLVLNTPCDSLARAIEAMRRYGEEVISSV
jgi:probable F420-dependent oxidoreductase